MSLSTRNTMAAMPTYRFGLHFQASPGFHMRGEGLFHTRRHLLANAQFREEQIRVSDAFEVIARGLNENGGMAGLVIQWLDARGWFRRHFVDFGLLAENRSKALGWLGSDGLRIADPEAFSLYIATAPGGFPLLLKRPKGKTLSPDDAGGVKFWDGEVKSLIGAVVGGFAEVAGEVTR